MSEKKTRKASSPRGLFLFRLCMLFVPYIAVLAVNRACYFSVAGETIVFSAAGMICAVVLLLLIFSVPRSSEVLLLLGVIFVLCALFSFLLDGAAMATGVAFFAKLFDKIIFLPLYDHARERALVEEAAQKATEQVKEVLKDHVGRV